MSVKQNTFNITICCCFIYITYMKLTVSEMPLYLQWPQFKDNYTPKIKNQVIK